MHMHLNLRNSTFWWQVSDWVLLLCVSESIGSSKWSKGRREQAFCRWEVWGGIIAVWTCSTSCTWHALICGNSFDMPCKPCCVLSETGMVSFCPVNENSICQHLAIWCSSTHVKFAWQLMPTGLFWVLTSLCVPTNLEEWKLSAPFRSSVTY